MPVSRKSKDLVNDGKHGQKPTPTSTFHSSLAAQIASTPRLHDNNNPLWQGPCAEGPLGGITQSMLVRFLSCRERFRLRYVVGLEPHDKWSKTLGFGNMWHTCEEYHAAGEAHEPQLCFHTEEQINQYPMQREEITKYYRVCQVMFPEYVKFWEQNPDVRKRTPFMQEQVFDIPYRLPSGRVVRLRGKFDSVDLIEAHTDNDGRQWPRGVWLQENKTRGDIDEIQTERQLKFDLQTMLYLIALYELAETEDFDLLPVPNDIGVPILGVRYNVVRRPLSGGKGSIRPHAAKSTKTKFTPAESEDAFYERLRRDYIADDPKYWFFRLKVGVSAKDIRVFKDTCLDPILEELCCWYDWITSPSGTVRPFDQSDQTENVEEHRKKSILVKRSGGDVIQAMSDVPQYAQHYRTPFGIWSALEEGGATEYDSCLETGSEAGLRRVQTLFGELQ